MNHVMRQSQAARVLLRGLTAPLVLGGLIGGLAAGPGTAGASVAVRTATCQVQGQPQPVSQANNANQLNAVAEVAGRCDVWGVGEQLDSRQNNGETQPLLEHFDGQAWKVV